MKKRCSVGAQGEFEGVEKIDGFRISQTAMHLYAHHWDVLRA